MKIRKVTCWVLRIPFTFPLVKGTLTLPQAPGLGFTPKAGILDRAVA